MKTELVYSLAQTFEKHAQQTETAVEYWLAQEEALISFLRGLKTVCLSAVCFWCVVCANVGMNV